MHAITHDPTRHSLARATYALIAIALAAAIAAELIAHGTGWWQLGIFGLGPDAALFAGLGSGLAKGQLHPRAIPLYNALHSLVGPIVLLALAATGVLGVAWLVGGLTWTFHIVLDRALGYGKRTRDGFQRA
jgi:Domain of unknown function (DUF4260)